MLHTRACEPCREGAPVLDDAAIEALRVQTPRWEVAEIEGIRRLRRIFSFKSVADLLQFQMRVMEESDAQGHHPTLFVTPRRDGWRILIDLWTHKIHGLHENDFIMAAKIDLLAGDGGGLATKP